MKKLVFIGILALLLSSCASNNKIGTETENADLYVVTNDSLEYEVIVTDPGFDIWFVKYDSESYYRSISYYKSWNRRYVSDWNNKIILNSPKFLFPTYLDIDVDAINDIAVQHELFYYFQFVERKLGIKVLNGVSPR